MRQWTVQGGAPSLCGGSGREGVLSDDRRPCSGQFAEATGQMSSFFTLAPGYPDRGTGSQRASGSREGLSVAWWPEPLAVPWVSETLGHSKSKASWVVDLERS